MIACVFDIGIPSVNCKQDSFIIHYSCFPAIIVDDETGTSTERIHLRISTSESANDYARFWESDVSPCYIPEENRAIFEFCLVPIDVVNTLPEKAPIIQYTKESGAKIQSRQQQVIDLLTGLRAYAEVSLCSKCI